MYPAEASCQILLHHGDGGQGPYDGDILPSYSGFPDLPILVLPLILQAYSLEDEGKICKVDDIPLSDVHDEFYQLALVTPLKVFNLKTFNQKLLKPEYHVLFDFVHKVFLSYAGTNESVTHQSSEL